MNLSSVDAGMLSGNAFSESNAIIQVPRLSQASTEQPPGTLHILRGGTDTDRPHLGMKNGQQDKNGVHTLSGTRMDGAREELLFGSPRVIAVDGPAASGKVIFLSLFSFHSASISNAWEAVLLVI